MPNPIFTILDTNEYADVVRMAVEQTLNALLSQRKGSHGIGVVENESYDLRIQGLIGEYVVKKYLKLPWISIGDTFSGADLGPDIDVKTASEIGESLIIRKNIKPEMKLVLVTPGLVRPLHWIIWGWITAEEGRKIGRRTNFGKHSRESVWAVSHAALDDMRELRDLCDLIVPFRLSEYSSFLSPTVDQSSKLLPSSVSPAAKLISSLSEESFIELLEEGASLEVSNSYVED